ncbi:MAG: TRAP transporter small permease subunit [Rhizobiales bacterium]|nr:TRAP transporter small permease subunit [Hyphomicrobiales bacterium]MBI3673387.1 TRAP transporter small permease subunit [Hyphomicrobiales bacterium]
MTGLLALSRLIDGVSAGFGRLATWLVLLAALVSAFNALARYSLGTMLYVGQTLGVFTDEVAWVFDLYRNNSNILSDLQLAMFAGMVMFGAPWTLKLNEHVRVDLIYGSAGYRTRDWIDLIGGVFFLVPICLVMIYFTWPWFLEAWNNNELSQNAGGLPRWPAKFCLPAGFALVLLQGISEIIKCLASLTTGPHREAAYEKPVQ